MNMPPATATAMLLMTLLLGACASLQPNRTAPAAVADRAMTPLPDDVQTLVWRDPAAAAPLAYYIAPVGWRLDTPALGDSERAELASALTRAIEEALSPASVLPAEAGATHRIEATITGAEHSSPALNVLLSALLGPLDTGGASVEIVVVDMTTSRPVAALNSARNGRVLLTKGYARWGHAKQALQHAAMALAKLLVSPAQA